MRMLTIIGTGGVGNIRLALHIVEELLDDWYMSLTLLHSEYLSTDEYQLLFYRCDYHL